MLLDHFINHKLLFSEECVYFECFHVIFPIFKMGALLKTFRAILEISTYVFAFSIFQTDNGRFNSHDSTWLLHLCTMLAGFDLYTVR